MKNVTVHKVSWGRKFADEREKYNYYMNNLDELDKALSIGAKKAKLVADEVLSRVREKVGY